MNGIDDIGVRAASADIATHAFPDFSGGDGALGEQVATYVAGYAGLYFFKHRDCRANLPRCAVTALIAVMFDERRLQRMQIVRRTEPFNGGDAVAFVHDCKRKA